jgi:hypothetical protein
MRKLFKGCLVVIGVLFLLGVIGAMLGGRGSTGSTAGAPTAAAISGQAVAAEPTAAPAVPTEAPAALKIGEDVTVDEMRWKVLAAENLGTTLTSDNEFIDDRTTTGRFVQVRFEMENLSKDLLSYAGLDLVDDQGRSFKQSSDVFQFIPNQESCVFENLNPNVAKSCTVIYEVPATATGLKVQVTDLKLLGGGKALVDLGLVLE